MILFDLKRSSADDGPGIRTVVFFKGCPLSCRWCHNPESQSPRPQLGLTEELCAGCGLCAEVCPRSCHILSGGHRILRERCIGCGACARACPKSALTLYGYSMSREEVLREIRKDAEYYRFSGGGVTFSGGEPMAQFEEALSLAAAVKGEGFSLCLETCGAGERQKFLKIAEFTDIFLFDVKVMPALYEEYTGARPEPIFENLRALDASGAKIRLRCPMIPGVNICGDHFAFLAELSAGLKHLQGIDLLPYHPAGLDKYRRLGIRAGYENAAFLEKSELLPFARELEEKTGIPVSIG